MTKTKKLLSVLLAMVMALSVMSVGFVAGAEGLKRAPFANDAAVVAIEKKIEAFDGDMKTATPDAETLKAYNEIVSGFAKLSVSQKEELDTVLFDKLLGKFYDYEKALAKADGITSSSKQWAAAHAKLYTTLGDMPFLKEAEEASKILTGWGIKYNDIVDALKKTNSAKARIYGTMFDTYYGAFSTRIENGAYKTLDTLLPAVKNANPYPETEPKSPMSKPKPEKFPGGEQDPDYIAAMEQYVAETKAYEEYTAAKVNYEGQLYINTLKVDLKDIAPEYTVIANYLETARDAGNAFVADKNNSAKALEALKLYDAMDEVDRLAVDGLKYVDFYSYTYVKSETDPGYTHKTKAVGDMHKFLIEIRDRKLVVDFEKYIATVTEPYTAAKYEEARAKYDAIPEGLRKELSAEADAKIKAMAYAVLTDSQSQEKPDVSDYDKTDVKYPQGASHDIVTNSLPKMDNLINAIAKAQGGNDLPTAIKTGVYTNATVAMLCQAIMPKLAELGMQGDVAPSGYLGRLADKDADGNWVAKNPEYNGAVAALANVVNSTNNWADVTFANGDWFVDGDKDGFVKAVSHIPTLLMNLSYKVGFIKVNVGKMIFDALQFENEFDFKNEAYNQGSYENFVHIFEAVGIPCIDSITYSEAVDAAEGDDAKIVARFAPIFDAVFDFVDVFAQTPVTTLTAILPNVAAALNSGLINDEVWTVIHRLDSLLKIAGVTLPDLDFTAEGLFNTIGILNLEGITFEEEKNTAGEVVTPDNGVLTITLTLVEEVKDVYGNITTPAQYATINIKEADFLEFLNDVEGCGDLAVADSVCLDNAYRATITADKADVFVTLVRFVYDDVVKTNPEAVKAIINAINPQAAQLLAPVIDVILKRLPADAVIVALVRAANPFPGFGGGDNPGDGEEGEGNKSLIDRILDALKDIFGGLFGGDDNNGGSGDGGNGDAPNVDDPDVPDTAGRSAGVAVASVAVLAGLGAAVTLIKRKRDEE